MGAYIHGLLILYGSLLSQRYSMVEPIEAMFAKLIALKFRHGTCVMTCGLCVLVHEESEHLHSVVAITS